MRLPNSTNAWKPCSGYGRSPQLGQFSQPRPEPVRRTKAPDVMTRKSANADAAAIRRNVVAETVRERATATAIYWRPTPEPGTILPILAARIPSAPSVASSTAARSGATEASNPPAVCGSNASASSASVVPLST